MVAYASAAAGDWGLNTNWTPNGVPGAGDTVTIAHAITNNATRTIGTGVGNAISLSAGGSLEHVPPGIAAALTFTINGNVFMNVGSEWKAGSSVTPYGSSTDSLSVLWPGNWYCMDIGGTLAFYGNPAWNENADLDRTTLNAQATSGTNTCVFVEDLGLRSGGGDVIAFGTDSQGWIGGDILTTSGYVSGTKTATFTTNFANNHAAGTPCANMSRNIQFRSSTATRRGSFYLVSSAPAQSVMDHVEFMNMGNSATSFGAFTTSGYMAIRFIDCAAHQNRYFQYNSSQGNKAFYTLGRESCYYERCNFGWNDNATFRASTWSPLLFRDCCAIGDRLIEQYDNFGEYYWDDGRMESLDAFILDTNPAVLIFQVRNAIIRNISTTQFVNTSAATIRPIIARGSIENCDVDSSMDDVMRYPAAMEPKSEVRHIDDDQDAGTHRIVKYNGEIHRDDTVVYAGDSGSLRFEGSAALDPLEHTIRAPVSGSIQIDVQCYCRKDSSYNGTTRPSITVSGLGVTESTATMTDVDDTWEQVSVTVTPDRDGFLDIKLWTTHTAGLAYFDAPNVVRS